MPFIPVLGVVQAEMFFQWDSQLVENVLHFKPVVAGYNTAQLNDLAAALAAWWNTNMKASAYSTVSLTGVKITDLDDVTGQVVDLSSGIPIVGTSVSPSLPNNVTCVFTKRTALRGRSFRGRIYHIGLTEAAVTGNIVSAGSVTGFITSYNLLTTFTAATKVWKLGVISRAFQGAPRVTGVFTECTQFTSDGIIDSQRRRLPGRGN
jgi:hypothetical protein